MPGSPLTRRRLVCSAALVSVLGAALSGCDLDPFSSPATGPSPPPDPDLPIVTAARAELGRLYRIVSVSPVPGGRVDRALLAAHGIQLAALDADTPPAADVGPRLSRRRVSALERRAADRFSHWAATCRSGDLARVLASIAAGISMQPVVREPSS